MAQRADSQPAVVEATEEDVADVAALYAAAFEANPAYRFIFTGSPAEPAPPGALTWLFERRARLLLSCGCPLLLLRDGDGRVAAAGGLVPHNRKPGMRDMVAVGLLVWPLLWGLASLRRLLRLDTGLQQLAEASGPLGGSGTGGELVVMAVRPDAQGRGLGKQLLTALVALWDKKFSGGLLVMTQLPTAAALYQQAGFQPVLEEWQHPEGRFTNWLLHRPAQPVGKAGG